VTWPHKELSMPYTDYVGNTSSYGTGAANPVSLVTLQTMGQMGSYTTTSYPQQKIQYSVKMVFNCILKDRNVAIPR